MILYASLSSLRWMPHRNFHPPGGNSALLQLKDCVSGRQAAATPFPVVWYFCSIQLHPLRTGANSAWQLVIADSYSTARDHSRVTCGCCVFGRSQRISKIANEVQPFDLGDFLYLIHQTCTCYELLNICYSLKKPRSSSVYFHWTSGVSKGSPFGMGLKA